MDNSTKTFWDRPEGKTGMMFPVFVGAGLIVGLAFIGLPLILATIASIMTSVTQTLICAAILAVPVVLVSDKSFRLHAKAFYQVMMKKLTGWVIELDPIAIIEGYLKTLEESLEKMNDQLNLLNGQASKLNTKVLANRDSIAKSLDKAHYAKDKLANIADTSSVQYLDMKRLAALEANKAARLNDSNGKLEEVLSKIVNLKKFLEKMYANSRFVLDDMTDEVKIKKEERDAVSKGYNAFKSAMKVLDGNKDEKVLFDESMEFMANDLGNKIGEIERFMDNSGSFLTSMDVDKEVFENKGLLLIDEWEKKGDAMFITSPKEVGKPVALSTSSFMSNNTGSKSKYL